ncbi:hypothetical protein ECG_09858 [Echinococcus granulosus]|nr:hypothetical protein ECG_09858 [Echinococcus granulosus]
MPQKRAVVVIVLSVLLSVSTEEPPITWPDPRHFHANVDRRDGKSLSLSWPVSQYCPQNVLQNLSVTITKVGDRNFSKHITGKSEHLTVILEQVEAVYQVTAIMKTQFNMKGVSAIATITTGGSPLFGSHLSLPVQEISQARVVGDGPYVVVLTHQITEKCMLVIYDATSANYTIEAMNLCQNGQRASLAVVLPIEKRPLNFLPKLNLLEFAIPSKILEGLPKFDVRTYSVPNNSDLELDPPCDIYGRLVLISPETARLTVTFRPPTSHPRLIHNFTFVFSHTNETIVFEVIDGRDFSKYRNRSVIPYSKIQQAQQEKTMHFEVAPKTPFGYPGNYTVTAFTNDAVTKRAVYPIIMPKFFALQPSHHEISVFWYSVTVKWGKPLMFNSSCTYRVKADPYNTGAVRQVQQPLYGRQWVTFDNLSPGAIYSIKLESTCTGSKPFWIHLGDAETDAGAPGTPRDVKLTLIGPKTVNLTWNPPLSLPGRHPYYEWRCEAKNNRAVISNKTEDTYTLLENIAPGVLSCTVQAAMKTKGFMDKYGGVSSPVQLLVPSPDLPQAPPVQIILIDERTVGLNLLPVPRSDVLGFIVTVDSNLTISFYLNEADGPFSVKKMGTPTAKALRTGPASLTLTDLTPYQTYIINVTTLFTVNYNTTSSYIVQPTPPEYWTTNVSTSTPRWTTTQQEQPPSTTATVGKFMDFPYTKILLLAVFGCAGSFLLAATSGILLQKWRRKNAAKMLKDPPPADLPQFSDECISHSF